MRSLIVYDTWFENTRQIAEAIAEGLDSDVQVIRCDADPTLFIPECELVIVGSPTHGGVVTPDMQSFLDYLEPEELDGIAVTAFDTRATYKWLRFIGFASGRIAKQLQRKGGTLVMPPEGFYVRGKEGPLLKGELARAQKWGEKIAQEVQKGALV